MAQITAAMVKQLREMTDSPMMECKKALVEADGDMDAAVDVLRKNGLAKAAKKAGRETNEGAVAAFVSEDGKTGALLELSCETDFVGSNAKFTGFASKVAEVVATTEPADVDALLEKPMGEETVSSELTEMIHIMGENMKISRFAARKAENGALASYIHMGGKIGVLVNLEVSGGIDATVIGKDIAMQIAALNPRFWDKSQVSEDVLAEEKKILVAQMDNDEKMASKPLQVKEKIAAGKMNKFFEENCLLQQAFVKDGSVTVEQYMNSAAKALGGSVKFVDAVRFEKGEGIEKKVDDFAAEVAAAAGLAK